MDRGSSSFSCYSALAAAARIRIAEAQLQHQGLHQRRHLQQMQLFNVQQWLQI